MSMYAACGPNVEQIIQSGFKFVRGKVPMQVRKELGLAVKLGQLGHVRKDGLYPEIYFHPSNQVSAMQVRNQEGRNGEEIVSRLMVTRQQVYEDETIHEQRDEIKERSERVA